MAATYLWPLLSVAATYNNMGMVYKRQGRHEEALVQYQRALEVFLVVYGQEHLDVAKSYGNIGNVLDDMGKPEEALVQLRKGLELKIKILGHEHRLWLPHTTTWPLFTTARVGTKRRLFSTKRRSRSELACSAPSTYL